VALGLVLGLVLGLALVEGDVDGLVDGELVTELLDVGVGFGCVVHPANGAKAVGVGAFWSPQPMLPRPHASEA
jgi:hypothetical protein